MIEVFIHIVGTMMIWGCVCYKREKTFSWGEIFIIAVVLTVGHTLMNITL